MRGGIYSQSKIHDTVIIGPGAKIGKDVKIGPYSVIGENVEIGSGTNVGSRVQINGWTRIGDNNIILDGVSIGLPPQHVDYQGEKTYLFIGDNNVIGEFVTIHRGTVNGGGETRIGNNNRLMCYSHVAHDCSLGNNIVLGNSANLAGHVIIENHAYISDLVGIHQFVRIGQFSFIATHTKVTKDVPPYLRVKGHPAQVEDVNFIGLEKYGLPSVLIEEIKKAYAILYKSGLNTGQAIEKMDQDLKTSEEIEDLIRFLKSSVRGICR